MRTAPAHFVRGFAVSDQREIAFHQVRRGREAAGLTQRELSDASGVSQKHISQIELSGANVTLDTLAELAKHLNTTAAELITPPRSKRD